MALGGVMSGSDFLGGWPSVFYVFGIVGLLWSLAWFVLIRDRPEDHPWISSKELSYIRSHSPTVKSSKNGILSAVPHVCVLIASPLFGAIADKISEKKWLSITTTRKLATGVGLYSSSLCLIAMWFVDCNASLIVVLLCAAESLNSAQLSGAYLGEQDISPNFAGVLKGIANSVASIAGFIVPLIVGVITSGNQTLSAWRIVFGIAAAAYFIGGSAYLIFGTDKVQPWNEPKRK